MSEQSFEMIAKTFQGLEETLAQELTSLGADEIQIGRRMVSFRGDKEMMYKANFCLRTAIRILKPIKQFVAKNADEVYEQIKAIHWEDYLDIDKTFAVDAVVFSEEFRHSKFVSYKVKDAIVVHDLDELHKELEQYNSEDVYVIGGESIYRQLLDECDVAHITKIDYAYDADAYFPNLDEKEEWQITEDSDEQTYFDLEYYFLKYERIR